MLVLSDSEVRTLFTDDLARETVRSAARQFSSGEADIPARVQMRLPVDHTELLVMPGSLPGIGALGVKTVGEFPRNAAAGVPTAPATVLLFDPETGLPEAFLDGTSLTLARTAAMSVVAAEHLAVDRPTSLAVIGAGGQALSHIEAFARRFPLERVRITSRTRERAHATAAAASAGGIAVEVTADAASAVAGADIVISATTARRPVVPDDALAAHACVIGIGAHSPEHAEIEAATVARAARVAVDTRRGSIDGAGDIAQAIGLGALRRDDVAELGELVTGAVPGRAAHDGITVFKSIGFAALDLVAARELVARARAEGLGIDVAL
ncbi:ornithine cyclodeaminase family protein [Microbacterium marinilacus]|uniref:Ornithine cyclodeaminase family protein n=1 Tax=Microbacterium marinilacus TaxID=415209 RepID=A0ABP7BXM3_9MICO|nr:ornithine cyclodeaminase family protein [Microbacterium marinilacus]MBY0688240.1 ornithine cyclodeaminase family protein [Microbacterium marinilacus]